MKSLKTIFTVSLAALTLASCENYFDEKQIGNEYKPTDVRTFDFSSIYNKGIFTKLQNPEYFRNYTLDGWTVDWNDEIGFAPEYLYEQGAPVGNK